MSEIIGGAFYQEFRPSLWWRFVHSRRWPWTPHSVAPDEREWGTQPYLVTVLENGYLIGWHPVDSPQVTTAVVPSRWSHLAGLFVPRRYEVQVGSDPEWMEREP